jgi:hypothetical protein
MTYSKSQCGNGRDEYIRFIFWWKAVPPVTAATEEFTGAGAAVTKTITVS